MNAPTVETRFQKSRPKLGAVGVDAARHAHQAEEVHREEGDVEADEHEPEVQLAEALVHQPPGDLREPVVDPGEEPEDEPPIST